MIRLERVRDNPSSVYVNTGGYVTGNANNALNNYPVRSTVAEVCGVDPSFGNVGHMLDKLRLPVSANTPAAPQSGGAWTPQSIDFWPNTLFDTREGTLRDQAMSGTTPAQPTLNGTMSYIELDAANLTNWFGGKIGPLVTSGQATKDPVVSPNDFVFYLSDRRGNYSKTQTITGGWPPLSYTTNETGEYGWNDIVNSTGIQLTAAPILRWIPAKTETVRRFCTPMGPAKPTSTAPASLPRPPLEWDNWAFQWPGGSR